MIIFCQTKRRWRYLSFVLGLVILLWWVVYLSLPSGVLTVFFLDIGQGDAILIEAPNGNQMLIDGGRGGQILSRLSQIMPWFDRSLDLVIATHPDADHIGGLAAVFNSYQVSQTIDPGKDSSTQTYNTYQRLIASKDIPNIVACRGLKIILDYGVEFTILSPIREVAALETNEASIVGRLQYGHNTLLLTGDMPNNIEQDLIYRGLTSDLRADILKVGHHGSKNSSSLPFLQAVRPHYAVISVGATNSYGHPSPIVLERLKGLNIPTLRTDQLGTVVFTSDGVTFRLHQAL
ncbi:MAG: MBL fold metallo-hydrolase [Candidatus Vogelbacteria bacterium]|nr:MBL fold metallo-hydrolase [Candidatus Vogelbacteria bacterium]